MQVYPKELTEKSFADTSHILKSGKCRNVKVSFLGELNGGI